MSNLLLGLLSFLVGMLLNAGYPVAMVFGIFWLTQVKRLRSTMGVGCVVWIFSYSIKMASFAATQKPDVFNTLYAMPSEGKFWISTFPQAMTELVTTLIVFLALYVAFIEPKARKQ